MKTKQSRGQESLPAVAEGCVYLYCAASALIILIAHAAVALEEEVKGNGTPHI